MAHWIIVENIYDASIFLRLALPKRATIIYIILVNTTHCRLGNLMDKLVRRRRIIPGDVQMIDSRKDSNGIKDSNKSSNTKKVLSYLGITLGGLVVLQGIVVAYLAEHTWIDSVGWILKGTVSIAGVQLAMIGVLVIIVGVLGNKKSLAFGGKEINRTLLNYFGLALGVVLVLEGLFLANIGSPTYIHRTGWIAEPILVLGIAIIFAAGFVQMVLPVLNGTPRSEKRKRAVLAAVLFLLLMIPSAIFF